MPSGYDGESARRQGYYYDADELARNLPRAKRSNVTSRTAGFLKELFETDRMGRHVGCLERHFTCMRDCV